MNPQQNASDSWLYNRKASSSSQYMHRIMLTREARPTPTPNRIRPMTSMAMSTAPAKIAEPITKAAPATMFTGCISKYQSQLMTVAWQQQDIQQCTTDVVRQVRNIALASRVPNRLTAKQTDWLSSISNSLCN